MRIQLGECNANCLQAHTTRDLCACACGGRNHGLWLKQYAAQYRREQQAAQHAYAN